MTRARVVDRDSGRKADLAAIHIGKKELGWDDDFYRSIMKARCGVTSSAQLDFAGRKTLLGHMQACGWQGGTSPAAVPGKPAARPLRAPLTPPQRLMWSLWQQLADAKRVDDRKMKALMAFAERQTGVAHLDWLAPGQETLVIESLKEFLNRPGGA
jgi:hypothetical protein